ncbi:hypothetical protein RFEPED_1357 [Rickettsia felis str. Pedreira]|uniref:Uncharacterized protein n=1 Tax=Rickettsia felis str. Pedreira TaxID=1359196 RepID=A0A0F3MU23_RICFI|nr:hypothetical protein RFEPED_1357 [Rickettsia felis str. Pedreira]
MLSELILASLRGKTVSFDEAISGVCYYFMRLPRRFAPRNDVFGIHTTMTILDLQRTPSA